MACNQPDPVEVFPDPEANAGTALLLNHAEVVVRENGLLFLSDRPLALWTEVQVALHAPAASTAVHSRGVVVECSGTRQTGYTIALWLLQLPAAVRRQLEALARPAAA